MFYHKFFVFKQSGKKKTTVLVYLSPFNNVYFIILNDVKVRQITNNNSFNSFVIYSHIMQTIFFLIIWLSGGIKKT